MTPPNAATQTSTALRAWQDMLSRFIVLIERTLQAWRPSLHA